MTIPVYIVTGSSRGIGAATAKLLASAGARVLINYTSSRDAAESTAAECEALGGETRIVQGNITHEEACHALVRVALESWGRIDGLVNNAATTSRINFFDLDALSSDEFARVLSTNVVGTFLMTREALPALRESKGSVVNVSSDVAFTGAGSSLPYNASKGAINAMTKALARVAAPDVRVNAVCPGVVDTGWMANSLGKQAFEQFREETISRTPLRRIATPDDVAQTITWLLHAPMVTGELVPIDGGIRLLPVPAHDEGTSLGDAQ
jgi:NAD(P)-dependent dehydrogenase (short-subunit alcohol dehydrogenase family)